MRLFHAMRAFVLIGSFTLCLLGQDTPGTDTNAGTKGIPPRATPADYQSQAQAGKITIAAEFTGHALPTFEGPLTTEEYIAVETAFFGPAGEHLKIAAADFSLRVNGKKTPLPSQPYGLTFTSLRDPEWVPPEPAAAKSKTSFGGSGQGQGDAGAPPAPVKIPIPVQRAMAQRVQRASLPEGERALPQAGLIFFKYRGKTENIESLELLYEGPAGKATVNLRQ
jgi:hypothetical protein